MKMAIFSVVAQTKMNWGWAGFALAGLTSCQFPASADPDFRVLLTSPDAVTETFDQESRAVCLGKDVTVAMKTHEGRIERVSVRINGETVSAELDDFLSRNMGVFPATYSLSHLACSESENGEPPSLELGFRGLRTIDEKSGHLDAFTYTVFTEGPYVSSQSSQSLGDNVIDDFGAYARQNAFDDVPGLFDLNFCMNGPPCPELQRHRMRD
ncbi:MAG: hypothetical protein AAFR33_04165 [Pseudomonadota bacterium]